jgi:hypothetical protein
MAMLYGVEGQRALESLFTQIESRSLSIQVVIFQWLRQQMFPLLDGHMLRWCISTRCRIFMWTAL